ncbi:VOC family protein [Nocardia noduli]|uniref:VOC family protein n=1 Tax=Nocardia noduli TaxID=2815722 RepID=UPI001C23AD3F|nr:VOC family protein [Nocardia noduli]
MTSDLCWIDLGVTDTERAADFYRQLLSWSIDAPDDTGYRIASLHDEPVAAFGPADDPGPPYWTVYVGTPDIYATTRTVHTAGAAILVPPTVAGDAGISAVAHGPQDIRFSIWQPRKHGGSRVHAHLFVHDTTGSQAFVEAALGWRLLPDGTITDSARFIATWSQVTTPVRPSPWLIRFPVADPAATRYRAEQLGAAPDPDIAGALIDPCGARFTLIHQTHPTPLTAVTNHQYRISTDNAQASPLPPPDDYDADGSTNPTSRIREAIPSADAEMSRPKRSALHIPHPHHSRTADINSLVRVPTYGLGRTVAASPRRVVRIGLPRRYRW